MRKLLLAIALILASTNCFAGGYDIEFLNQPELQTDNPTSVSFKLKDDEGKTLTLDDLEVVHTQPVHFLIIDQSLNDYQHVHVNGENDKIGIYSFTFTPKKGSCGYVVWVDIKPKKTSAQQYIKKHFGLCKVKRANNLNTEATIDGLKFSLKFDSTLKAGEAAMGHITIEKDGKPFTQLEPVMGAFGHIVAFPETLDSVIHVHPMGAEPTKPEERGGPQLDFHLQPHNKGFVRLYAQVRVDGKDIFAPFGLMVE